MTDDNDRHMVARAIARARYFHEYGERLLPEEVDAMAARCTHEAAAAIKALDRYRRRTRVLIQLTEPQALCLWQAASGVMFNDGNLKRIFPDGRTRNAAKLMWTKVSDAVMRNDEEDED